MQEVILNKSNLRHRDHELTRSSIFCVSPFGREWTDDNHSPKESILIEDLNANGVVIASADPTVNCADVVRLELLQTHIREERELPCTIERLDERTVVLKALYPVAMPADLESEVDTEVLLAGNRFFCACAACAEARRERSLLNPADAATEAVRFTLDPAQRKAWIDANRPLLSPVAKGTF